MRMENVTYGRPRRSGGVRPVSGALLLALGAALLGWTVPTAGAAPFVGGFVEAAQAVRVDENEVLGDGRVGDRSYPRSELRTQLTVRDGLDLASFFARVDLVSDATAQDRSTVDVREAYIKLFPADWLEVKFGRQVATWGTGDLVFANDLFAKDWQAFFTGLDDSYLKPPQDLLRLSFYMGGATAEMAGSPHFTPDHLPEGRRLSVYNPFQRALVAAEGAPAPVTPPEDLTHGELFGRLYGYWGSFEWAFYGYKGFWPTPQGVVMSGSTPRLAYPRLASGGGSLRGPLGSLLVHAEGAAYISEDDPDGDDPLIANSQVRGFVGAEKSLGNDWTVSSQYYGEYMLDYDKYADGFGDQEPQFDELRSTVTLRVTKLMMNQYLRWSFFGYWGISDSDWHVRPSVSYQITDGVTGTVGGNFMDGDELYTMFGQFQDNSNVYLRLRYSF